MSSICPSTALAQHMPSTQPLGVPYPMPQRRKLRHVVISLCLVLAVVVHPGAYVEPPQWWQKGWARERVDSLAEAELLSQLAVILMPKSDIGELFRSFPSPKGWGGHALEPDLALHGVLKERDAALFVEYDGFWRHQEKKGIAMDRKKNAALLSYAPKGSCVVRISHTTRNPLKGNVLWVKVDTWSQGKVDLLLAGWWFGCHFLFSHILGRIIPIDEVIFFRGVAQPPTSSDLKWTQGSCPAVYLETSSGDDGASVMDAVCEWPAVCRVSCHPNRWEQQ